MPADPSKNQHDDNLLLRLVQSRGFESVSEFCYVTETSPEIRKHCSANGRRATESTVRTMARSLGMPASEVAIALDFWGADETPAARDFTTAIAVYRRARVNQGDVTRAAKVNKRLATTTELTER